VLREPFEKNISAFTEEFIGVFASGCFMHFNKAVAAIIGCGSWLRLCRKKGFICAMLGVAPVPAFSLPQPRAALPFSLGY